jgi:two-component system sensor histidine kinase DesK
MTTRPTGTGQDEAAPAACADGFRHTPGTGGPLRWFFSGIWLVYLAAPVSGLFGHRHGALWIAGGLAITIVFCGIYLPILIDSDQRPRLARYGLAAITVLTGLACVVYGRDWTPLWIYVSAAAGLILGADRRAAVLGVALAGACYSFFSWLSHLYLGNYVSILIPVLLVGLAMIGFRMQIVLMRELTRARETVAKLAADEERLRLARDMHDLTGQSLSMITLKSELAAKRLAQLPPAPERDAALTELGDIGRVSRQTLHDIREAVSGYRKPTLAIEVITARTALDAAGIRLDDDAALALGWGDFDPDVEVALAWCLREAVTNVIRHSGATTCWIRLVQDRGELSLVVTDDGRGPTRRPGAAGSGLRGMSERLTAAGGRLSLGPAELGPADRRPGFRLVATVPVPARPAAAGQRVRL